MTKKQNTDIMVEKLYSIGEASKKLGLSAPTLRMYEHHGVLIPYKAKSGRRYYSDADIERIKCIKHLIKDVGLNLEGIRRLFALLPC
ncbi:MAG: helix-turn-helix domain-containing protein [bacterium]